MTLRKSDSVFPELVSSDEFAEGSMPRRNRGVKLQVCAVVRSERLDLVCAGAAGFVLSTTLALIAHVFA